MVHRSALTLKLLDLPADRRDRRGADDSLPEQLGGERNWDYRYTWIRDAAFSLYALLRLGFAEEAEAFMGWLTRAISRLPRGRIGGPLQIMYGIDGRAELPEEELTHLEGYRGSAPVRIGNGAADQLQLDIYGELIDSVYLYNKHGDADLPRRLGRPCRIVEWLSEHWDQPDEGIWETRGGRQHFTYSRLMCWVAVERAVRIARQRGLPGDIVSWMAARDEIYRQIMARGWQRAQASVRPALRHRRPRRLDPADAAGQVHRPDRPALALDARRDRPRARLRQPRLPLQPRRRPRTGCDGDEGTFSMCTFWYVEALARAGTLDEARLAFEKMLTYANHLGLYSEEIGPTGEQLGNFPQAFTHLGADQRRHKPRPPARLTAGLLRSLGTPADTGRA